MPRKYDPTALTIFTTGQAARLLGVSSNMVKKWCDAEKLPSFRVPFGEDRRIHREALIAFMRQHSIPTAELGEDATLYQQQATRAAQLEDVAARLLSIVAYAISKGLPITDAVASARNDACALLPKTVTDFRYDWTITPEAAGAAPNAP